MKVGGSEIKANLQALREAAPAKPVRVDANEGWKTKEQALEMINGLRPTQHQYVEQPCRGGSGQRLVCSSSVRPADFGDESYHLAEDVEKAAEWFHVSM